VLSATTPRIQVYDVTRPSNDIAGGSANGRTICNSPDPGPKALTKNIALGHFSGAACLKPFLALPGAVP
jgi:hypothetical protein